MRLLYSYRQKFLMIIPAVVFAFYAIACGDVKDPAVYEQSGDAHTEYETMNEEPHYIDTESEMTPYDDEASASEKSLNNELEVDGNKEEETLESEDEGNNLMH